MTPDTTSRRAAMRAEVPTDSPRARWESGGWTGTGAMPGSKVQHQPQPSIFLSTLPSKHTAANTLRRLRAAGGPRQLRCELTQVVGRDVTWDVEAGHYGAFRGEEQAAFAVTLDPFSRHVALARLTVAAVQHGDDHHLPIGVHHWWEAGGERRGGGLDGGRTWGGTRRDRQKWVSTHIGKKESGRQSQNDAFDSVHLA